MLHVERFQQAVEELRLLGSVQGVEGRSPDQLVDRVFRLAREILFVLDCNNVLRICIGRANKYRKEIESEFFQTMCRLAEHFVLLFWKAANDSSNPLPPDAEQFILDQDNEVNSLVSVNRSIFRDIGVQLPIIWSDQIQARSLSTLEEYDLREFGRGLDGPFVGRYLPTFLARLKRVSACLGEPKQLRHMVNCFDEFLAWVDREHLRGSMIMMCCHDDYTGSFYASRGYCIWLEYYLHDSAKAIAAAAESVLGYERNAAASFRATPLVLKQAKFVLCFAGN